MILTVDHHQFDEKEETVRILGEDIQGFTGHLRQAGLLVRVAVKERIAPVKWLPEITGG